jgi:hypothetical protein
MGGGRGRTRRAPPNKIGKNMIVWHIIVIFHTKYPKQFRASLCSARFFLSAPPPPPLTWNPGAAPETGSLTAIWSKVSCTICYIIHNLPKLLQSVSEHHWMHNMDILNTNTKTITKMKDTHRKMEIYISPLKFIFKLTRPLRTINQEPKYTNTWRRTRDNKLKFRANLMVSFVC